MFWHCLKENHPVAYEVVWWTFDLICLVAKELMEQGVTLDSLFAMEARTNTGDFDG